MTVDQDVRLQIADASAESGSWWPRSRSLTVELPALLRALWSSGHDVYRVVYNPAVWERTVRGVGVSGRYVKLEARRTQDPEAICLIDNSGWKRTTLRIVPPHNDHSITDVADAHRSACVDPLAWLV